jgi:hypothetical protein
MSYEIEGIGDIFNVKMFKIATLQKIYDTVIADKDSGKNLPDEVYLFAIAAGYALDFDRAAKSANKPRPESSNDPFWDIKNGIIELIRLDTGAEISENYDKELLTKRLGSFMYFLFYTRLSHDNMLDGFYIDSTHRDLITHLDDGEPAVLNMLTVAKNVLRAAVKIDPKKNEITVNGRLIDTAIDFELDCGYPVNPKSHIFSKN